MTKPDLSVRVASILRGLLAEPTGDNDHPHRPVLLRTLSDGEGLAVESGLSRGDLLQLKPLRGDETDETLRPLLAEALARFEAEYHAKPGLIFAPGAGAFKVITPAAIPDADPRTACRVALVTGAAGAIGFGICQGLLEAGYHVAITDLPGERLDRFVAEFHNSHPERTVGVAMDVTDAASVARGFAEVTAKWGGIDLMIINAGVALACALTEIDLEVFRRLERVNVEGTLLVLAEAGRHFARQKLGGDIVLISTKNVFAPGAGFGAYSATKAAAHQLARIASLEFAPLGVRVNMVAPDAVFSGGSHRSGLWAEVGPGRMKARGLDEKGLEDYYRNRNLLKAPVTARHVANAVLFFALRQTPTTGACIPVDGGLPDATPR